MTPLKKAARQVAKKYGLPESVFVSLVQHESGFNPRARSPVGAIGLTQLMPATARGLGVDPNDPVQNLEGGARYLRQQLDKFGRMDYALAAYNAGPGAVDKYGGVPPYKETQRYVKNIMASSPKTSKSAPLTGLPSLTSLASPVDSLVPARRPRPTSTPLPFASTADTALANIGKIAQGWKPTDLMQGLVEASQQERLQPMSLADPAPPLDQSPFNAPLPMGQPGKPKRYAASGQPVPKKMLVSIGGEHETAGLAGYPAHDFMAPAGAPAVAPVTGKVIRLSGHDPSHGPTSGPHGPFGWSLYIQGDDGRTYFLTHMGRRNVKVGQQVKAGDQIGTVGNYKRWGGADHIHMGVS